jgi:hypothetical protein
MLDKDGLLKEIQRISQISEEKFKDLSFCILLIFWVELTLKKLLTTLLLDAFKSEKRYSELINLIFNETTFISKIKITEFIINANPKYKESHKDFFSFCKALNETRNQIFHVKLENITYKNLPISDINTQKEMLKDLIRARLKMGIKL